MKSFLIGAATSNSGKTTFTMGLLRALRNRGYCVQPFKCGPDYIDTIFNRIASSHESINIDTFMASKEHAINVYRKYSRYADLSIVEGGMGLFDGYDGWHGSSAEISTLLDLPVILIVNAQSMAYSVAPLIFGFMYFNKNVHIAGVVFNNVASKKHLEFLAAACKEAGAECMGFMTRNPELVIPGRHLGLTVSEEQNMNRIIDIAAMEIEKNVDIDKILNL